MSPCPSYVPACAGLYTATVRPRAPSAAASAAVVIVLPTSVSVPVTKLIFGGLFMGVPSHDGRRCAVGRRALVYLRARAAAAAAWSASTVARAVRRSRDM